MDNFILPSLYEGLPVVGVEAQCAGLTCLFSDSITREVDISNGKSKFISISDEKKWVEELMLQDRSRNNNIDFSKYNISEISRLLTDFYYGCLK